MNLSKDLSHQEQGQFPWSIMLVPHPVALIIIIFFLVPMALLSATMAFRYDKVDDTPLPRSSTGLKRLNTTRYLIISLTFSSPVYYQANLSTETLQQYRRIQDSTHGTKDYYTPSQCLPKSVSVLDASAHVADIQKAHRDDPPCEMRLSFAEESWERTEDPTEPARPASPSTRPQTQSSLCVYLCLQM